MVPAIQLVSGTIPHRTESCQRAHHCKRLPQRERSGLHVRSSELRLVANGEAHEIVENENLSIAIGARADADGRDAELLGNPSGKFARHRFQHDRKCACGLDGSRVALELARSVSGFALNVESAECVYGLRRQADMAHHRYLGFHQARDQFNPAFAAFDFYRLGSAFLH